MFNSLNWFSISVLQETFENLLKSFFLHMVLISLSNEKTYRVSRNMSMSKVAYHKYLCLCKRFDKNYERKTCKNFAESINRKIELIMEYWVSSMFKLSGIA